MTRKAVILALLALVLALACNRPDAGGQPPAPGKTLEKGEANMAFRSVVAGQFYPDNPDELKRTVDRFLAEAQIPADLGPLFGVVSPHAGYVYSGPVAGYSFKAAQGAKYDVVVVLGLSHRAPGTIAVLDHDSYRTPLGDVRIDRVATAKLKAAADFIEKNDDMFRFEHSLEVQLPFIQRALPSTPVVMVVIGSAGRQMLRDLAEKLDETFAGRQALFVASSDMSHIRTYDQARAMDLQTLDYLAHNDIDGLNRAPQARERLCGLSPVTVLFELHRLRKGHDVRVLKYLNSGDTAGDKSRVVGYGAVALLGGETAARQGRSAAAVDPKPESGGPQSYLSAEDKQELLKIARQTLERYYATGKRPDFEVKSPALLRDGAAFVTLQKKPRNDLRGCIGQIVAREPLWQCVRNMAIAAATEDPRFPRVTESELPQLHIEVSVLTPPERVRDVEEIQVGVHGLIIGRGFYRGLLLPQVATEYNWDRNTFLDQTCRKAGLPSGCWREKETTIEKFSAVVFSE